MTLCHLVWILGFLEVPAILCLSHKITLCNRILANVTCMARRLIAFVVCKVGDRLQDRDKYKIPPPITPRCTPNI